MRFFTIHERPGDGGGERLLPAAVVAVPSGFSWWAALVPPLWFLRHRLWLGLAGYVVFSLLLSAALELGGIADPAVVAITLAVDLLIGLSAADFRRWTLARRGWRQRAVLRAENAREAEERALFEFARPGPVRASSAFTPASAPAAAPLAPTGQVAAFPRLLA